MKIKQNKTLALISLIRKTYFCIPTVLLVRVLQRNRVPQGVCVCVCVSHRLILRNRPMKFWMLGYSRICWGCQQAGDSGRSCRVWRPLTGKLPLVPGKVSLCLGRPSTDNAHPHFRESFFLLFRVQ